MDKNEFVALLKDPDNLDLATQVVLRAEAVQEIEEYTQYPVTRNGLAEAVNGYLVACAQDKHIQQRKKANAEVQLRAAWAKALSEPSGWQDISERAPEKKVMAVCNGEVLGVRFAGNKLVEHDEILTLAELKDSIPQELTVKVKECDELSGVLMDVNAIYLILN